MPVYSGEFSQNMQDFLGKICGENMQNLAKYAMHKCGIYDAYIFPHISGTCHCALPVVQLHDRY